MKQIRIKDLYAGMPDAKDENLYGSEWFEKTYVVNTSFDVDSLINGAKCFITGYKGTGKTALLYYLADRIRREDDSAATSFIFFKEDYADASRTQLQELSRRIVSTITVDTNALVSVNEFEYIWRWLFFKRIIADNDSYSRNLFLDDDAWNRFENLMSSIASPQSTTKMRLLEKIKISLPIKNNAAQTEVDPAVEIDLGKGRDSKYEQFIEIIDKAEEALKQTTRTNIPYYIFVDELEAYYGEEETFKRDLKLIRDLIFTVKYLNDLFYKAKFGATKVICSVRSEILNAISRFVVSKEINKLTSGFSISMKWDYTNSNSYAHPIMQILLKRIQVCSEAEDMSSLDTYKAWFPETIHNIEPANYILNNSWCKPRDIVRLISSAKNCLQKESTSFSQAVFDALAKQYSAESLEEIREELRALYESDQIETIIRCFTGFKTMFSFAELQERVDKYYSGTILSERLQPILNDLFRLGFIGNYLDSVGTYHWQHKGDSLLILTDDWRIVVHRALHKELTLSIQNDRGLNRKRGIKQGDKVGFTVQRVNTSFAIGIVAMNGKNVPACIHVSEFGKIKSRYIQNLSEVVAVGDYYMAIADVFDKKYNTWRLKFQ